MVISFEETFTVLALFILLTLAAVALLGDAIAARPLAAGEASVSFQQYFTYMLEHSDGHPAVRADEARRDYEEAAHIDWLVHTYA